MGLSADSPETTCTRDCTSAKSRRKEASTSWGGVQETGKERPRSASEVDVRWEKSDNIFQFHTSLVRTDPYGMDRMIYFHSNGSLVYIRDGPYALRLFLTIPTCEGGA